jgi:hypothetical protein
MDHHDLTKSFLSMDLDPKSNETSGLAVVHATNAGSRIKTTSVTVGKISVPFFL